MEGVLAHSLKVEIQLFPFRILWLQSIAEYSEPVESLRRELFVSIFSKFRPFETIKIRVS